MNVNTLLQDIVHQAAEDASHVLKKWLKAEVSVAVEGVDFIPISEIVSRSGGADDVSVGLVHQVEKGLEGVLLLSLDEDSAYDLLSLLIKTPHDRTTFSEMDRSALMETSNILSSAYMNSLRKRLDLEMIPGPPIFLHDLTQSIVGALALEQASFQEESLFIDIQFHWEGKPLGVRFFYMPIVASLKKHLGDAVASAEPRP